MIGPIGYDEQRITPYEIGTQQGSLSDRSFHDLSLSDAIANNDNLNDQLLHIMEQNGLETNELDAFVEHSKELDPGIILQGLLTFQHELEQTTKEIVNLRRFEKDHSTIIAMIKKGLEKRNVPVPIHGKNHVDGIIPHLPEGMVGIQTRIDNNRDVVDQFQTQIEQRTGIHMSLGSPNVYVSSVLPVVALPQVIEMPYLVQKEVVLSVLQHVIDIYEVISRHDKWKEYSESLRDNMKHAFEDYCKVAKQHHEIKQVTSEIEHDIKHFQTITEPFVVEQIPTTNSQAVKQLILDKRQADQAFYDDLKKYLKSKELAEQMNQTSHIFLAQYKIMNEMIRPYMKPNSCKICMSETTNCFLEKCGHTFCKACLEHLLETNAICPCCRKPFTKAQIKPLYL